jgi:hypothetical protein
LGERAQRQQQEQQSMGEGYFSHFNFLDSRFDIYVSGNCDLPDAERARVGLWKVTQLLDELRENVN